LFELIFIYSFACLVLLTMIILWRMLADKPTVLLLFLFKVEQELTRSLYPWSCNIKGEIVEVLGISSPDLR